MTSLILLSIIFLTSFCFIWKIGNFQIPSSLFQLATFFYFSICYLLGPNSFWILFYYLGFWPPISQNFEEFYYCKQFDLLIFSMASFCYLLIYCLVSRKILFCFSKKDVVFWIAFLLLGFLLVDSNGLNPTKELQNLYDFNNINFQVHYLQIVQYFLLNVCFFLTYIFSFLFYFDSFWFSGENKKNPLHSIGIRLFVLLCLWTFFSLFLVTPIGVSFFQIPTLVEGNHLNLDILSSKILDKYKFPF